MKNVMIMKKDTAVLVAMLMFLLGSLVVNGQQHTIADSKDDSTHMQEEFLGKDSEKNYDDELSADEINPAVSSAIVEKYPGFGIAKVYQSKEGSYKVELEKEDGKITAYYSSDGELLNVENNQVFTEDDDLSMNKDKVSPQEQFQRSTDDYDYNKEIEENELPQSVTSSLDDLYPDHEVEHAYRGGDGSFKVKVKDRDDEVVVYYTSEGLFYRDEKVNFMKNKNDK